MCVGCCAGCDSCVCGWLCCACGAGDEPPEADFAAELAGAGVVVVPVVPVA